MDYSKELRELFLMQQIYATLTATTGKIETNADKYYKGLTSRQYMTILAILHLQPHETTLKNIAQKLGTTKQNVTQMVNAIEKKGYIVISPSEVDKRAINMKITDAGIQAIVECSKLGVMFLTDVFQDFDEEEMEILWRLLKKLYRYDGQEDRGFEDDVNDRLDGDYSEQRNALLEAFSRKRRGNGGDECDEL